MKNDIVGNSKNLDFWKESKQLDLTIKMHEMSKGKILFQQLLDGCCIVEWSNSDVRNVIEYYKFRQHDFEIMLSEYYELTERNVLFLILANELADDESISKALGVSQNAVRSMRCRINKRKFDTK